MYHGHSKGREDGRSRGHIGRSPPRRRRSPEGGGNKFCMYCKVQISSQRLYDEHCSSAVHKQKEIIIAKALSDGLQYCYSCEKIFPSKLALDAHCLMTRHKPLYRVDELQPSANQSVNMSNLIQVVTPQNDTDSRRAREDKEREDIVTKLKEVRGNEETDNKDLPVNNDRRVEVKSNFCEVCNVDCISSANYKIHTESWRHRSEVDKRRDEKMKKLEARKKFEEEAEKTFDAAEEAERKKVPDNITGKAGYFCEVCSIASADESHYLEHLKTRKHFRQIGQMRRPYKCYFCEMEFNVAKDFNYHLESQPHMDKAFKKGSDDRPKKPDKDEEWVEKKTDRRESRNKDDNRDSRKEDHSSRKDDHSRRHSDRKGHDSRSKDGKKDIRKAEIKEKSPKSADCRKVEIIDSPVADTTGIKDLREKLKAQKIIITKENSPEKPAEEEKVANEEEPPTFQDNQLEAEKLDLFEKEFETKFKELIKECDNNNAAVQERLSKDREEDINMYQKYEDDFKELQEVEDFNRNNIEKLEDGDPCKEDFIIDIIRVQRKMEDLRQQMEVKEMMIIKREILYRKYFPEKNDEKEAAQPEKSVEEKNLPVYDYSHVNAEEANEKPSVADVEKVSNGPETGSTDLRIKLERERLLKRLGPELEAVDPALREKLLSVIMEKDQTTDNIAKTSKDSNCPKSSKDPNNAKSSKDPKTGDTRQVLKDSHSSSRQTQMDILTKREKQLEIELAKLKSNAMASVKKKTAPKSLVPQYDDVDDKKKKDPKKRPRHRSISISSVSSSSSSSSDISKVEKNKKKKRKKSPVKVRAKSKTGSGSGEKNRRKRRSTSRERDKKKKITTKKARDDDKKKKTDRLKTEKKKVVKLTVKPREKVNKVIKDSNPLAEDNDSDVQEVTPKQVQSISVIGSVASTNIPPPQVTTTTTSAPSLNASAVAARRKEQFSCWKSSSQPRLSPKEDIWDSAFSGGQEDNTAVSSTINLFDPSSGTTQLPEDILNILKSVAPIIQQTNQQQTPLKDHSKTSLATSSPESCVQSDSLRNYNMVDEDSSNKEETFNNEPVNQVEETTTRIRSILKNANSQSPALQNVHRDSAIASQPSSEIPKLVPSLAPSLSIKPALDYSSPSTSKMPENNHALSPAISRRPDNIGRSILKQRSSYGDTKLPDSDKLYEKPYSSTDGRSPPRYTDQKEEYMQHKHPRDARDTREYDDSNGKPYGNIESNRNNESDTMIRNKEWQDTDMARKDIALGNSRPFNEPHHPDSDEMRRRMYRDDPVEYKRYDSSRQDIYNDKFRQPSIPMERDRSDHLPSSHTESALSRSVPPNGRVTTESPGAYYNSERNPIPRQPFVRSEVTHRVIDYSYVRDTRIISDEKPAAPAKYNDDSLKQPVRYPGETDDEYYARFERFYEMTRRKESGERAEYPLKNMDDTRINPDTRHPPPAREDLYRPSDRTLERFDDRLPPRIPPVDDYRNPPMGRVESVRRVENVPLQDDRYLPYRRSEIVESRYTTDTGRNRHDDDYMPGYRDKYPRDNRNFTPQDSLKPLPPVRHLPPSPHRLPPAATPEVPPRQPPIQPLKLHKGDFQDY